MPRETCIRIAKKEMFLWLKKADCERIDVGCESGSPRVLRDTRKRTTVEKIINVLEWAKEYVIKWVIWG
jgi:radical SAM superfamily enzyme YgiQ (UPF0313 family)